MKKPAQGGLEVVSQFGYVAAAKLGCAMRYEKKWEDYPITQTTDARTVKALSIRASIASIESDEWPVAAAPILLERPILCDLMEAAYGRINPNFARAFKSTEDDLARTDGVRKSHFRLEPTFLVHLIFAAAPVLFPNDPDFNPKSRP